MTSKITDTHYSNFPIPTQTPTPASVWYFIFHNIFVFFLVVTLLKVHTRFSSSVHSFAQQAHKDSLSLSLSLFFFFYRSKSPAMGDDYLQLFVDETTLYNRIVLANLLPSKWWDPLPHVLQTWLRNYIAGTLLYLVSGLLWCFYVYYLKRNVYVPKGNVHFYYYFILLKCVVNAFQIDLRDGFSFFSSFINLGFSGMHVWFQMSFFIILNLLINWVDWWNTLWFISVASIFVHSDLIGCSFCCLSVVLLQIVWISDLFSPFFSIGFMLLLL